MNWASAGAVNSELLPDLWSNQLSGSGVVHDLECRLVDFYSKRHALAVSNATLGLYAISLAVGLRNREVVTTPLTWGGTIAGPLSAGARIVFSDVDPVTLTLEPHGIESKCGSRTAAIVAVDFFGVPADDEALRKLADSLGLWYIHDAAQSFGARIAGRPAGSMAHAIIVSFSPGKGLSAGEGGAILTDDDDLYERLVWLTQHPDRQKRELGLGCTNELALNMRIHPIAAAWAAADFDDALIRVDQRGSECNRLISVLNDSGVTVPLDYLARSLQPSFFRFTAAWQDGAAEDAIRLKFRREGLSVISVREAGITPLYRQIVRDSGRRHLSAVGCSNAERAASNRFELRWSSQQLLRDTLPRNEGPR
jgi:dTDP-4-amino-4,6-dideoxygalactose transaminase